MSAPHQFDVIIAGAGPAGTTAALAMQGAGLRIALIDKCDFPRDKTCGDALAAYVPKVLRTIDPQLAKDFLDLSEKQAVDTCRIISPGGYVADLSFGEYGFIMKREHFDFFLWKKAMMINGLQFFPGRIINRLEVSAGHCCVETNTGEVFTSKMYLACDGANGSSARFLAGRKLDPHHHSAAVRVYFKGVDEMQKNIFELHFLKELNPGYLWIFPLPNGEANVGLGMPSDLIAARRLNLRAVFEDLLKRKESPLFKRFDRAEKIGEVMGMGLPLGSRKLPISGDGYLLCGDAASLIDPLSGEGIGQAIVSGRYAGWQVKSSFEKGDFTAGFLKEYDRAVYRKIWKDHRRRYRLRLLIEKMPRLFDMLVRLGVWRWMKL